MTFPTIPGDGPLPVVLVGAGLMGQAWMRMLQTSPDADLVGLVDLDQELAHSAAAELGYDGLVIGTSVSDVASRSGAKAVINVTVPRAHVPVTLEAVFAGLPVLCEKPLAPTVGEALAIVAAAEASGQLVVTSQNRRFYDSLASYRQAVAEVSPLALLTTDFAREAHFPGFRETMRHPLLVDMAVHAFDVSRYLLLDDPVSVWCETFNPSWSWFDGDTVATAVFEFAGGVRYRYTGSWTTRGLVTSWNGSWRAAGEHGTATWDGEREVRVERADATRSLPGTGHSVVTSSGLSAPMAAGGAEEIAGSLADFVDALRTGRTPESEVHSNVHSLAMVEAAVRSADTGERVHFDDVLEEGHREALALDLPEAVASALAGWGSARAAVDRVAVGS
ncbi:Gfo/Idh/MocA family protein [Frondihabitans australicus]|uniref:Putative dehydrogenase n=1 Tax=Frondihabitans australicus TaxID=386892 RepID=A0A495IJH2_9MICO|nr:Gfo/Idh/MocA family oxidoreductase [Frondihabitans australicus]RKR76172.1 putative dehydrogenase [Frondihabitans australicus]